MSSLEVEQRQQPTRQELGQLQVRTVRSANHIRFSPSPLNFVCASNLDLDPAAKETISELSLELLTVCEIARRDH